MSGRISLVLAGSLGFQYLPPLPFLFHILKSDFCLSQSQTSKMKVEGLVDLQQQQKASTKSGHHSLSDGQLEAFIAELGSTFRGYRQMKGRATLALLL
jgi:hypothetical protein